MRGCLVPGTAAPVSFLSAWIQGNISYLHHPYPLTSAGPSVANSQHTPGWYLLCRWYYPLEVTVGKSYGQLLFQVASPRASLRPWPSRWWALGKQVPGQVHACHSTPGLRQSFKCLHHWIEICLQPLLYFLGDTKGTLPSVHAPGLTKAFIHLLIHSTLSNLPCVRYNQQEVIHSDKCSQHKFVQRATEP